MNGTENKPQVILLNLEQHLHLILHNLSEGKLGQSYASTANGAAREPTALCYPGWFDRAEPQLRNTQLRPQARLPTAMITPHCTRPEPAPPTCDLLEGPSPKCNEKLQHRYCCSRFL